MLAMHRIVRIQHSVIREGAAQQHANHAHARVNQHAQGNPDARSNHGGMSRRALSRPYTSAYSTNRPRRSRRLKPAARPEIAVKLHIQGEQQNQRQQQR